MTMLELRNTLETLNSSVQEAHRVHTRALDLLDDLEDEIHMITTLEEDTPLPELVQERTFTGHMNAFEGVHAARAAPASGPGHC